MRKVRCLRRMKVTMSVCSDELLALAESLIVGENEASNRASVSRSYYALYHEAVITASFLSLPEAKDIKTAHERLIFRYSASSRGLSAIGRSLRKQKLMRAKADYDIRDMITSSDAKLHVATTRRVVSDLRRITSKIAN